MHDKRRSDDPMFRSTLARAARARAAIALVAFLFAALTFADEPAATAPADQTPKHSRVRIVTNMGTLLVELEDERAPLTVANFLAYVREGQYNCTTFHHAAVNCFLQGGGSTPH